MQERLNILAVVGLALGAGFGRAGTVVEHAAVRSVFGGIDGAGPVMATCLLALKYLRRANDTVASGFLVFAIGEGVIMSGAGAALSDSLPSFAAGSALWATALLLVSIPGEFPDPGPRSRHRERDAVRRNGAADAVGGRASPISTPLPLFAYPFLVLTFIGWGWTILRENAEKSPP